MAACSCPTHFGRKKCAECGVEAVIAEAVRIGVAASMIKNDLGRASESRERILAEWTKRHATAK
jgi:hypothetical protein